MKKVKLCVSIGMLLAVGAVVANCQCPVMPAGFLCITQAAGNVARGNAVELAATKEKVTVLETALADTRKEVANVQKGRDEAVGKLTDQNTKLLVEVADKSGALGECRGDKVMYTALIEYLTKNQRSKQGGLFNVKIGGN